MKIDKKDYAILDVLKHNGRLSTQKIAKKVNIPITTVHNRIRKLGREGVIKNYTVNIDQKKLGRNVTAYILITVDYKLLKERKMTQYELAKKIRGNPNVELACMITGLTDILIKITVKDMDELGDFVTKYLRNVDGVERTQTAVILSEV